jgi:tRNA-splicing ligase RtcB (3'-phosphate/5'-hydroxy nucleic acid ligase)
MREIQTEGLVIKSWCEEIEPGALEQALNIARLPFAFHHIALMPDAHQGFGMPIGGVLATVDMVVPNAVGVDIGCGMAAVSLDAIADEVKLQTRKEIIDEIRHRIPVGFKHRGGGDILPWDGWDTMPEIELLEELRPEGRDQIGTLGGGNHFIELQADEEGRMWLMVHTGSRNFGLRVAQHYHKRAVSRLERKSGDTNGKKTKVRRIPNKELAYLPMDSQDGSEYLAAMQFAVRFSEANRSAIREQIEEILRSYGITATERITAVHNYAAVEQHFGREVVVHRKGAIRAGQDELGIVPGSQGTRSYIVKGKGNPDSFVSSSHGAGRKMGRKQAQRTLSVKEQAALLDAKGIIHAVHNKGDLDEAPGAYKDIDAVMAAQGDLVEIVHTLSPLAVVKA